jgi:hypothetical protein
MYNDYLDTGFYNEWVIFVEKKMHEFEKVIRKIKRPKSVQNKKEWVKYGERLEHETLKNVVPEMKWKDGKPIKIEWNHSKKKSPL